MPETPTLGMAIRARREDLDLTREQLLMKVNADSPDEPVLSLSTLIRIELRGGVPRVHTLAKIASVLDVSIDELLATSEPAEQSA